MTTKLDSKLLKQLILEEMAQLKENPDLDPRSTLAQKMAQAGAGDIPGFETGMRGELVQLFMDLLGPNADKEEVNNVASAVADTIRLLKDQGSVKEGVENLTPENLKLVYDVLVKMSPLIAGMSIGPALMMAMEKLKQKKSDRNAMDEDLYGDIFEEEVEKYLEESLYYGLIEEDDELLEKKKKKKACKPSKGKKFARRVKGKCVSYGQAGKAKGGGARIKPGTGKGNAYCARSYGDMKSHGKDCSGKDRGTPLCLSRQKWKCSGKYSRKGK